MSLNAAWIWKDGAFAACDSVPLSDRGFRYGMSVFESLPVRNGKPFFLPQHYERLQFACKKADFGAQLPPLEENDRPGDHGEEKKEDDNPPCHGSRR